jgi:hypothetical protein
MKGVSRKIKLCEHNWKLKMSIRDFEELCCERDICSLFVVYE